MKQEIKYSALKATYKSQVILIVFLLLFSYSNENKVERWSKTLVAQMFRATHSYFLFHIWNSSSRVPRFKNRFKSTQIHTNLP